MTRRGRMRPSPGQTFDLAHRYDPAEPRDPYGRWFHGTRYTLKPGDILEGGKFKANQGYGNPEPDVYFTERPDVAAVFANAAQGPEHNPDALPKIYEVEPVDEYEDDPDEDPAFKSFRSRKMRVVRQMPNNVLRNTHGVFMDRGRRAYQENINLSITDLAFNPAEKRDKDGKWTKAETTAWLDRHPVSADNVVTMWDQATPGEKESGEVWYPNAHKLAVALGKRYGVSTAEAAGLLATYSPQTPWGKNVTEASEALRENQPLGGPGAHVWYHHDETTPNTVEEREGVMAPGMSRNRAARIMAGENPDEVFAGGRLKSGRLKPNSLKIRAFADLIANGTQVDPDNARVVIDRHAAGVARGVRFTDDDYNFDGPSSSVKKFSAYAEAYREASRQISAKEGRPVPPEAVQAATWLARQRLNGAMVSQVGKTRSNLGKQDAANLRSYIDQYLPEARTFLPQVGYTDLARPQRQYAAKPPQKVQQKPPPQTTQAVVAIAALLALGLPPAALAAQIAAVLLPWKIDVAMVQSVLDIVDKGTNHRPNAILAGARPTEHVHVARDADLHYRAAYIANAAHRLKAGESLAEETRYFALHEEARRGRLKAAAQVQTAADFFGIEEHDGTLVGWYLNPLLNNEAECIAANGHNFYAEQGTVIGLPGSVHNRCGCYAGPPWTGAAMVDEVFSNLTALIPRVHAKFKLKQERRRA